MASSVGQALLYLQHTDKGTGRESSKMIVQPAYKAGLEGQSQAPRTLATLRLATCFRQWSSLFLSLSESVSSLPSLLSFWPCHATARQVLILPVKGHVSRTFQTQSGQSVSSRHSWYFSQDSQEKKKKKIPWFKNILNRSVVRKQGDLFELRQA